ncbi:MAG: 50S ribosomal protein L18Ae [Candidatus Odinarchaeota archaeon]|nr:50S ribosomal protein L18Ae [Candidatus Thorarchaeota archaeon]
MSSKIWRASGEYTKNKRKFRFTRELLGEKEDHVREKIFSELGSRHRVRRKYITISEVKQLKPEEVTDLDLRRILGLESEFS